MTQPQAPTVKTMNIIWMALIGGLLSFGLVTYFAIVPGNVSLHRIDPDIFYILSVVLAVGGMMGSNILYRVQVRAASQQLNPGKERLMAHYMTAFLLKMALLEGPGLFSIVAALLTQQVLFAAITAGILLLMIIAKPTEMQFREDFLNGRTL